MNRLFCFILILLTYSYGFPSSSSHLPPIPSSQPGWYTEKGINVEINDLWKIYDKRSPEFFITYPKNFRQPNTKEIKQCSGFDLGYIDRNHPLV